MIHILYSYKKNKIGSQLIRFITGEKYSHCAILARGIVYESVGHGVHEIDLYAWLEQNTVAEIQRVPQLPGKVQSRARDLRGRTYDYPALFWFALTLLVQRLTGLKLPRLAINPRWLICSEFVWKVLLEEDKSVTPRDVYDRFV